MTISHVHCQVRDLPGGVSWFTDVCGQAPGFSDARLAVFEFGAVTLILDADPVDSTVTIGFSSRDCDADCDAMVRRGARVLEPPADRSYGVRVAYLQGPGAVTIEIEQLRPSQP